MAKQCGASAFAGWVKCLTIFCQLCVKGVLIDSFRPFWKLSCFGGVRRSAFGVSVQQNGGSDLFLLCQFSPRRWKMDISLKLSVKLSFAFLCVSQLNSESSSAKLKYKRLRRGAVVVTWSRSGNSPWNANKWRQVINNRRARQFAKLCYYYWVSRGSAQLTATVDGDLTMQGKLSKDT